MELRDGEREGGRLGGWAGFGICMLNTRSTFDRAAGNKRLIERLGKVGPTICYQ